MYLLSISLDLFFIFIVINLLIDLCKYFCMLAPIKESESESEFSFMQDKHTLQETLHTIKVILILYFQISKFSQYLCCHSTDPLV